ncbi:MAG: class I SAM-dependent methyltransferase [Gammaproteobacteria bacterium]|nr:class I SAM-dependent methyltransferase [Gammaproteobacteria bacterium]
MQKTDRKKMIQQGFDTVAAGYDHPSLSFFPETAKRLIEHLQLNPADNLLDVCSGTGCVALAAAEKLTEGKVTGIDLSTGMLCRASNKAEEKGLTNVEFKQLDLDHLCLAELNRTRPFDIATSSFGLFFLEDMVKGLTNIAGTVKPGGKVAITTFTGDAFAPMADIFVNRFESTGRTVPPLSWKRLATEELIKQHFNAVGITKVEIHHEPLGYHMTDPQMWWDVVWNAGWRSLLNQLSVDEQELFKDEHIKEIADVLGNDGVWFNTEVLIAVGEKF